MRHHTVFILAVCLCGSVACSKKVEKTYVEREQPAKVVVEERRAPETVTRERVTESQTNVWGDPIEQRRRTTTTVVQ